MLLALTREVPDSINECQLTHLQRVPIDVETARAQHTQYEAALRSLGIEVVRLPPEHALPDSVFVEDTAVVLDTLAVITRPGAPSRRPEIWSVESALSRYRRLVRIEAPGTLDGGDVLSVDRTLYVGRSERSNDEGIRQLQTTASGHGYRVVPVDFQGALHLKSAATKAGPGLLLLNPEWVNPEAFGGMRFLSVDPAEPGAANVLAVGGVVLVSSSFPRTRDGLIAQGLDVREIEGSELEKAEAGLTCGSLIFESVPTAHGPR